MMILTMDSLFYQQTPLETSRGVESELPTLYLRFCDLTSRL